jgi:hypothetical protein
VANLVIDAVQHGLMPHNGAEYFGFVRGAAAWVIQLGHILKTMQKVLMLESTEQPARIHLHAFHRYIASIYALRVG